VTGAAASLEALTCNADSNAGFCITQGLTVVGNIFASCHIFL
jgi:hypothetical protein